MYVHLEKADLYLNAYGFLFDNLICENMKVTGVFNCNPLNTGFVSLNKHRLSHIQ